MIIRTPNSDTNMTRYLYTTTIDKSNCKAALSNKKIGHLDLIYMTFDLWKKSPKTGTKKLSAYQIFLCCLKVYRVKI